MTLRRGQGKSDYQAPSRRGEPARGVSAPVHNCVTTRWGSPGRTGQTDPLPGRSGTVGTPFGSCGADHLYRLIAISRSPHLSGLNRPACDRVYHGHGSGVPPMVPTCYPPHVLLCCAVLTPVSSFPKVRPSRREEYRERARCTATPVVSSLRTTAVSDLFGATRTDRPTSVYCG